MGHPASSSSKHLLLAVTYPASLGRTSTFDPCQRSFLPIPLRIQFLRFHSLSDCLRSERAVESWAREPWPDIDDQSPTGRRDSRTPMCSKTLALLLTFWPLPSRVYRSCPGAVPR